MHRFIIIYFADTYICIQIEFTDSELYFYQRGKQPFKIALLPIFLEIVYNVINRRHFIKNIVGYERILLMYT